MKKQSETSFSFVSIITSGITFAAAFTSLTLFSACNHSTSNAAPITTGGGNSGGSSGGTLNPNPEPTACPAWGCGTPPIIIISEPTPQPTAIGPEPVVCPAFGCNYTPTPVAFSDSTGGDTKDVDLQRAEMQDRAMDNRAQAIADKFDMDFNSAHQLAVLADRVQTLTAKGAVSTDDEAGVVQAAIGIAGLSQDEVTTAIAKSLQGDDRPANDLMEKAAQNLGMSSSATLRDQLLPALGISN